MTDIRTLINLVEAASRPAPAEIADTITVDGRERPTRNSLGEPIHKTEAGIVAFWRWFGESKVVDQQGRPRVVYHGTDKRFTKFSTKKSISGILWFTSNRASIEAGEVGAAGAGVLMKLYVKIDNPADWKQYDRLLLAQFKGEGLDGAILPDRGGEFDGFAFSPHQFKSAEKNRGTFDPASGKITESANQIPYDPYGYWIMPDGEVVPTEVAAHVESAMRQLGYDDSELDDDYEGERNFQIRMEGLANGAVRVVLAGGEVGVDYDEPTLAAMQSLVKVLSHYKDCQRFDFDGEGKRFGSYREAMQHLRQYIAAMG